METARQKFFIILLLSVPLSYLLQDTSFPVAQSIRNQTKKGSSKNITLPFDSSLIQLTPNFVGHNLKDIFNKLQARQERVKEKNEFETTEEFEEKKSNEATKPIIGKLFLESILAFTINDFPAIYDADTETLKAVCTFSGLSKSGLYFAPIDLDLSSDYRAVQWKDETNDNDSYLGTNAFGATVKVTRKESKYYRIAIKNHNSFEFGNLDASIPWYDRGFVAKIHLSPDKAKKIKSNIKFMLICKLIPPYTSQNYDFKMATFKDPNEETNIFNYIYANVLELWIFDFSSGIIFYKAKATLQG